MIGWHNCLGTIQQIDPHCSLVAPIVRLGNRPDFTFQNRVATTDSSGQAKNLFLDVWGKIVEPHDLRHPRRRDLPVVGQFRLIDDDPVANQVTAAVGQGQ